MCVCVSVCVATHKHISMNFRTHSPLFVYISKWLDRFDTIKINVNPFRYDKTTSEKENEAKQNETLFASHYLPSNFNIIIINIHFVCLSYECINEIFIARPKIRFIFGTFSTSHTQQSTQKAAHAHFT